MNTRPETEIRRWAFTLVTEHWKLQPSHCDWLNQHATYIFDIAASRTFNSSPAPKSYRKAESCLTTFITFTFLLSMHTQTTLRFNVQEHFCDSSHWVAAFLWPQ